MSYFVTGINYKDNVCSSYIFDSKSNETKLIPNAILKSLGKKNTDFKNVRLKTAIRPNEIPYTRRAGSFIDVFKPATIVDNTVTKNNQTLIELNFNTNKAKLIDIYGQAEYIDIAELEQIIKERELNNVVDSDGKLVMSVYDVIGEDKSYDVIIRHMEKNEPTETFFTQDELDIIASDINEAQNINEIKETKPVEAEQDNKIEPAITHRNVPEWYNLLATMDNAETQNSVSMNIERVYEFILISMAENDIITMPKFIADKFTFEIKANLESSMDMDKRLSLGLLKIENDYMIVAMKIDSALATVKIQVFEPYGEHSDLHLALETIKLNYHKWKADKQYLSFR